MNAIMFFGLFVSLGLIACSFWLAYAFGFQNGLKRGMTKGKALGLSRGFEFYRTESKAFPGLFLSPEGHALLHKGKGF